VPDRGLEWGRELELAGDAGAWQENPASSVTLAQEDLDAGRPVAPFDLPQRMGVASLPPASQAILVDAAPVRMVMKVMPASPAWKPYSRFAIRTIESPAFSEGPPPSMVQPPSRITIISL